MKHEAGAAHVEMDKEMLNCKQCGTPTRVLETRSEQGGIARRRECLKCKARVTTLEMVKGSTELYKPRQRAAPTPKPKPVMTGNNVPGLKAKAVARKRLEEMNDMRDVFEEDDYSISADELRKELGY